MSFGARGLSCLVVLQLLVGLAFLVRSPGGTQPGVPRPALPAIAPAPDAQTPADAFEPFHAASPPGPVPPGSRLRVAALAIFKDEAHAMEEWISHHLLLEGFDALVLLDNGSTDRSAAVANATAAALNRTSDVHVLNAAARSRQSVHYNAAMPLLRSLADVALVADLDEFLYSADGTTAADHLRAAFSQPVAQITLPMLRFGSSGHAKQPPSIRKGFVHRRREHPAEDALFGSRKSAVRLASTLLFVVHVHQVFGETVAWDAGGPVRLNHYRIQSREFFGTVKMGRGDVAGLDRTAGRDWGYFEREDYRDVVDTGLKDKVEAWERRGGR